MRISRCTSDSVPAAKSAMSNRIELVPQSIAATLAMSTSAVCARTGGPPVADPGEHLVTERVHAGPPGQCVRDMDMEAFHPVRHPAGTDLGSQRFHRIALGQVGLMGGLVGLRELGIRS